MKWGNVTVSRKEENGDQVTLYGQIDLADQDFKKTEKLTWVLANDEVNVEIDIVELDHLISKAKLEENETVQNFVNRNSKVVYTAIGEGALRNLQKGQTIQLERRGYFYVDHAMIGERKLTLHLIPDGSSKDMSKVKGHLDKAEMAKGKGQGKAAANKTEAKKAGGAEANA